MRRLATVCLALLGCADAGDGDYVSAEPAPLVGVDGSLDQADRNCHVVLRDLERNFTGFTYETVGSSWVWQGSVEISEAAAAEGLVPSAMYRMAPSGSWSSVTATPSLATATPGYVRYTMRIHQGLPGPGWSGTSLSNAKIEVVPFIAMPEGGRLFDHNRHRGDLDNYLMTSPDLAVWTDATVCAPPASTTRARLVFDADWSERREGILAPGGELTVVYADSRLTQCRNWQGGNPRYDITAHLAFSPGNQRRSVSVRDGAPVVAVPSDARGVDVWFENTSVSGCQAWDSNNGANYHFDALTPPQWIGNAASRMTRTTDDPCAGGTSASQGFTFDTWTRQRAAITNLCFEVYHPGLTDRDDPDLWQKLDAKIHYRYVTSAGSTPWQTQYADLTRRVGNNAQYVVNWRGLDGFHPYRCHPIEPVTANGYDTIGIEYYLSVNGGEHRPQPGAAFAGTFLDYVDAPVYCNP